MKYAMKFTQDKRKQWWWKVYAQNGQCVATAHEGYSRLSHCRKMAYKLFGDYFPQVKA